MANIRLEHVSKIYDGKKKNQGVLAVDDFNLEITKKEFVVFVGPSGCGKSTTLRMIAGLEEITSGELYIDGELMNAVEPKFRNIAMVFQNYALYPHMTAYDNMAFGLRNMKVDTPLLDKEGKPVYRIDKKAVKAFQNELKKEQKKLSSIEKQIEKTKDEEEAGQLRTLTASIYEIIAKYEKAIEYYSSTPTQVFKQVHLSKAEIDERIQNAAKILDIVELLDRKPKAMSGGQRQRVALGRAIVRTPKVFLLDEPLSNLDAKLRSQMRVEITKLYEKLDTPFIYVTHDQVEAMTMGTIIVVMRSGVVQQIDTPTNLYDYPSNRFVAGFLGTPQMNFYEVSLDTNKTTINIQLPNNNLVKVLKSKLDRKLHKEYLDGENHPAIVGIRSEDIKLVDKGGIKAKVVLSEVLGSETLIYADFNLEGETNIRESLTAVVVKVPGRVLISNGSIINLAIDESKIHLFDSVEEKSILSK